MSTILKALRRLEQEKASGVVRPLREQVVIPSDPQRRWLAWLLGGATVSLGVAVGAAALLMGPGLLISPWAPGDPVPAALEPAGAPEPAEAVALPEPFEPPPAAPVVAENVAPSEPPEVGLPDAALTSPVSVVQRGAIAAPIRDPDAEVAAFVASHLPPASLRETRQVPGVSVMQTVWHPKSSQRTAQVRVQDLEEPLVLREGDAVGPLVVLRIEPSAVVFLNDAVEIRHRVGGR